MKISKKKYELTQARACIGQKRLEDLGISRGTLNRALNGESIKPETAGRIAKALGVDVTEILEDQTN